MYQRPDIGFIYNKPNSVNSITKLDLDPDERGQNKYSHFLNISGILMLSYGLISSFKDMSDMSLQALIAGSVLLSPAFTRYIRPILPCSTMRIDMRKL